MARESSVDGALLPGSVMVIPQEGEALLKDEQVGAIYGCSVSTVWARTKCSPEFPQPIRMDGGRFTRWKLSEIREHINRLGSGAPKPALRGRPDALETGSAAAVA